MSSTPAWPVFQVDPPQTLLVGHNVPWSVSQIEFQVSRRGWLRALGTVTFANGTTRRQWLELTRGSPGWLVALEDQARRALRTYPNPPKESVR